MPFHKEILSVWILIEKINLLLYNRMRERYIIDKPNDHIKKRYNLIGITPTSCNIPVDIEIQTPNFYFDKRNILRVNDDGKVILINHKNYLEPLEKFERVDNPNDYFYTMSVNENFKTKMIYTPIYNKHYARVERINTVTDDIVRMIREKYSDYKINLDENMVYIKKQPMVISFLELVGTIDKDKKEINLELQEFDYYNDYHEKLAEIKHFVGKRQEVNVEKMSMLDIEKFQF